MAISWRAIRFALVSFVDPPLHWLLSEPIGFAVAPPLSPYTGPGQSPRFAMRLLELRSVFHTFPA